MARNLYCVDQNPKTPISCPVCTYSMDRGRFADVPTYKFLFWCPSNKKSTFCRPEGVYGWSRKGPRTVRPSPTPTTLAIESALPCPGGVAGTGHMEVRNFPRAWQPGNALNAQGGYHPVSLDRWIPKTHFSAQPCTPKGIIGRNLTTLRCRPRCAQCQICGASKNERGTKSTLCRPEGVCECRHQSKKNCANRRSCAQTQLLESWDEQAS